jgi:hypothetical protein
MSYNETLLTKGITMKRFIDNLKRQAEENPVLTMFAAAAVITATTKLMQANTDRAKAQTHAKEVDRRTMMALINQK